MRITFLLLSRTVLFVYFLLTILFFILSATIVFKTKCFDGPKFFPDPLKEFQTRLAQAFLSSGNPTQKMLLCQALTKFSLSHLLSVFPLKMLLAHAHVELCLMQCHSDKSVEPPNLICDRNHHTTIFCFL